MDLYSKKASLIIYCVIIMFQIITSPFQIMGFDFWFQSSCGCSLGQAVPFLIIFWTLPYFAIVFVNNYKYFLVVAFGSLIISNIVIISYYKTQTISCSQLWCAYDFYTKEDYTHYFYSFIDKNSSNDCDYFQSEFKSYIKKQEKDSSVEFYNADSSSYYTAFVLYMIKTFLINIHCFYLFRVSVKENEYRFLE